MQRFLAALVLALTLVILAVTGALAHAGLISTDPADGEVLPAAPATLRLTYTEPVSPISLSIVGVGGTPVALTDFTLDGPVVHVTLPANLAPGSHLFSWRVTSEDGHPVNGTIGFAVGAPSGSITAAAADPVLGAVIWLVRTLQYVALFFGVGGIAFGLVSALPDAARKVSRGLALMGLVLVPAAIGLDGTDLLGLPLSAILTGPPWGAALGNTYAQTQVLFALAFILALLPGRWAAGLAALCGALAPVLSGHASAASPQVLMRAVVFVHIASLLFWIGALLPLALILRRGGADALDRFARIIPYAVGALVVSGGILAAVQFGFNPADWPGLYGGLFAGKLVIVALLLLLALWNRVGLTGRAMVGEAKSLRRSIAAEIVLAAIVFGIVAGWRFTPPPRVAAEIEAAKAPVTAMLSGTDLSATLTASPGRAGPLGLSFTLPIDARAVTVGVSNPDQGIATIRKDATPDGDRRWQVNNLLLPVGGAWSVDVEARIDEFDVSGLHGTLTLPPLPETLPMNRSSSVAAALVASSMVMPMPAIAAAGILPSCPTGQVFTHGPISVSGAFTRATPKGAQSAGAYLLIKNTGTEADTLTGASSEAASDLTLHSMSMNGNVMEMAAVEGGLAVPAGGSVSLDPMGYHLMMTGMGQQFAKGECVQLTLHFAKAGDVPVELNVGGFGQQMAPTDMDATAPASSMDMGGMDMGGMSSMPGM